MSGANGPIVHAKAGPCHDPDTLANPSIDQKCAH
jgi:hypothetical protein